jgi:hypothetical protein
MAPLPIVPDLGELEQVPSSLLMALPICPLDNFLSRVAKKLSATVCGEGGNR